ncbi:hypothetical protein O181_060790 [Austropuccinia psidii MF-1]|uniref:Uncharacterized protein n=1 Tax=Austropuccinia psidii MF-1 TaxID=1389203 RepID=A0A9Q3EL45_9BASI|nr:hypothetical protein [Austropuccinia psidii MF-1]
MDDFRASTCCQRLASTFETLLNIPESEITAIAVVRPESFPTGNSEDIPVSVQELVCGRKKSEVGTSAKSLCRDHEFLSSIKEALGPRKYGGPFEWLDTHVLQSTSPKDKCLAGRPKHFISGPEKRLGPKEGQQPSGSSSSIQKQDYASTSAKKVKEILKEQ